jgi:hypothetical protein
MADDKEIQTDRLPICRQIIYIDTGIDLAQPGLNCDLPRACRTGKQNVVLSIHSLNDGGGESRKLVARQSDQDMGIKQEPHYSGQRPKQKLLRKGIIKIVSHEREYFFDAALLQEFVAGLQPKHIAAMGNQIKYGLAIAGYDYGLALLDYSSENG